MDFQPQTVLVTLPSGREAVIREMTGEDEDLLTNEKLVKAGRAQNMLIGNLLMKLDGKKPVGQDVMEMWSADRAAVLLHARALSFGPALDGKHECQNADCKTGIAIHVDDLLHDLKYVPLEGEPEYEVTLPSGKAARLRPMRGSDEARMLQARQKGELVTELLFSRIIDIEGIDPNDRNQLRSWLRSAPLRERRVLRESLERHEFGYQTQVDVTCHVCNTEQRVDVMSLTDFFFPGSPEA
jgi:hypothetical protein